ncbi:MAG TPA: HD domain-containing protein [Thermoanaerobaculia bacterium]|nr:HD domain-containing protein [Thermoanaerobaculia bacterium]
MLQTTEQLAPRALAFAVKCHHGQRRESDGTPFVSHPIEVARLLRDAGCAETVIAAGLLHDVLENGDVDVPELSARFGPDVATLVDAVTDDSCVESYRRRKQLLRDQVRCAGGDVALLYAAAEISTLRELPARVQRDRARLEDLPGDSRTRRYLERHSAMWLEHSRASLAMLEQVIPGHELVGRLCQELERCSAECGLLN